MKATLPATYKRGAEVSDEKSNEIRLPAVHISGLILKTGKIAGGVYCDTFRKHIGERSQDDAYLEATKLEHIEFHRREG
jgi:hypothetical protein